jgi:hypothetical protein
MDNTEKNVMHHVFLKIPAGQATAKAPLGPTLGQCGVPIADFCNKFNKESQDFCEGVTVSCELITYDDDSYSICIHKPDIIEFIKQALEVETFTPTTTISITEDSTYPLILTTGMLIELIELYLGVSANKKVIEYWFKRLASQLRYFGVLIISTE